MNRRVTKDECSFCAPTAIGSDYGVNPRDRMVEAHVSDHDKIVINGALKFILNIGGAKFLLNEDVTLSTATDLDTGSISNGKDYYVYACNDGGTLVWKMSLASTYPAGFNATTSRKISGFHTLCVNVGTISGHTLTGYLANDILPASIWDFRHRAATGNNEGLVYDASTKKWIMIYLASGTGASTVSAYLGTISDSRSWMDFCDDGHAVGMRLPNDHEFQSLAAGSNEETNIVGSADPGTTGGHSDTASRRMISDIGCEDCAGVVYQWLGDQSWRLDGADLAACQTWLWENLPGAKGSLFKEGTEGDVKLRAGGSWSTGTSCGSRCRLADRSRWYTHSTLSARFLAEPLLGI